MHVSVDSPPIGKLEAYAHLHYPTTLTAWVLIRVARRTTAYLSDSTNTSIGPKKNCSMM